MKSASVHLIDLLLKTSKNRIRLVFASLDLRQSLFSIISITVLILFFGAGESYGMPINGNVTEVCPVLREVVFSVVNTGSLSPKYYEPLMACLRFDQQQVNSEIITALVAYILGEVSNVDEELWSMLSVNVQQKPRSLSDAFYRIACIKRQTSNTEERAAQFEEALQSENAYLVVEGSKELLKSKKERGISSLLELKDLARIKIHESEESAEINKNTKLEARIQMEDLMFVETAVIQYLVDAGMDVKQMPKMFIGENPYEFVMWVIRGK